MFEMTLALGWKIGGLTTAKTFLNLQQSSQKCGQKATH